MDEDRLKQFAEREERIRSPRFWWHWQNLKEDSPKAWLHGSGWLNDRRSRFRLGLEWLLPSPFTHASIEFGDGDYQITASLACPLFAGWIHVQGIRAFDRFHLFSGYSGTMRKIGLSFYSWSLSWTLWADPSGWSPTKPRWRDGWFDLPDFLLGKATHTKTDQEPIPATLTFAEGDYPVTVVFFHQRWKRPRWPWPKLRDGAEVNSETGIPVPGKGENSWDCDDDAFLSIGASAKTVEEALAQVKAKVEKRREQYGGHDWKPFTMKER